MRLLWVLAAVAGCAHGQVCAPSRILPAGTVSGSINETSCRLSDTSPYSAYRLDLPARGRIRIALTGAPELQLILRDSAGVKLDSGTNLDRPIEAGAYTLLVNSRTPAVSGDYAVTTAFTAEAGSICSTFPSLGLGQTTAGRLGSSGCVTPGGAPYEAYRLRTFGSGTLTITVSSSDFTPALVLRTSDGTAAASGDGSLQSVVDAGTTYEVVVTGDAAGTFAIASAFEPGETETCRPARTLAAAANSAASIGADSCATMLEASGETEYYDYYLLSVEAAGEADIAASSSDFAPALYLLDSSGDPIANDSGSGNAGASEIRMHLRPGSYTVRVVSASPAGGAYKLDYQFTPGAPRPCAPAAAAVGDLLSGAIGAASCRTELGPAYLYSVQLPSSGTVDLSLTTDAILAGTVGIRDSKDNLIVAAEDAGGLGTAHLSADLPAGAYTVVAGAASGAGGFQLAGKFSPHDIQACASVQPLDINGGYIKALSSSSCRGNNGGPLDLYEFTLPADATVAAIMTSGEVDSQLSLLDSAGAVLRTDDNSYGSGGALIVQYLPAGKYRIAARAAAGTDGGLYEVDVRSILGPRPPFCSVRGSIPIGGSTDGRVDFSGCQYPDATFADLYRIDVADSGAIDIRMDSTAFDAALVLLDGQGNVIDRDDDSGGGSNARINLLLAPGTYYVVAKASAGYVVGGAYTLSVSQ